MLVTFGGLNGTSGLPPFEFARITRDLGVKRLFVRDLDQCWYQGGLPGLASGIEATAEFLRSQLNEQAIEKAVFIGASMGGYAALLFGSLLHVDCVHAFSPQTYLGLLRRMGTIDIRWYPQINRMHARYGPFRPTYDLRRNLLEHPIRESHVHFGMANRLDRVHALRLSMVPGVTVHGYGEVGHHVVRNLRATGRLRPLLTEALHQPTWPDPVDGSADQDAMAADIASRSR